jgi:hypothetical protein
METAANNFAQTVYEWLTGIVSPVKSRTNPTPITHG